MLGWGWRGGEWKRRWGGYMLRTGVGWGEGMYNYVRYEGSIHIYRVG